MATVVNWLPTLDKSKPVQNNRKSRWRRGERPARLESLDLSFEEITAMEKSRAMNSYMALAGRSKRFWLRDARDDWSVGVLESWVLNPVLHYSITPTLQSWPAVLFLARRAIERAAVSKRDSFDRTWTHATRFTVAIVDPQMILKLAVSVVGVAIVRERRAAPADRFTQDGGNHESDSRHFLPGKPGGAGCGSDTHAAKNFVGVNISYARDHLLVQQEIPNPPL
jgi:hypothetical protein